MDIRNGRLIPAFTAFRTAFFATEDIQHTQFLDLSRPSRPIANSYRHIAWKRRRCQEKATDSAVL